MYRNRKTAFTLIELLVVIAIIALIAAILFPVFARVREKARQATCLSNEKQIGAGLLMYLGDYDERFPIVLNWSANWGGGNTGDNGVRPAVPGVTGQEPQFQLVNVVAPYLKNVAIWYCPSVGPDYVWQAVIDSGSWKPGARMRDQGTSYMYTYLAYPYVTGPLGKYDSSKSLPQAILLSGKSYAIVLEPSRKPLLFDEPVGCRFTGNIGDPPSDAVPHSGGLNVVYADAHAKFHRIEKADGDCSMVAHNGDGIYPGQ